MAHTFSAKSIGQFEQYMHHNLENLAKQWDQFSELAHGGYAKLDSLNWFNYTAFDIIGDLAFGAPFGMLEHGRDIAEVRASPDAPPTFAPAIEVLNRRGEVSGTLGCYPALKPYAKYLPDPFFSSKFIRLPPPKSMLIPDRGHCSRSEFGWHRYRPCQSSSRECR